MLRLRRRRWLASSALALCVSGCAPDDERSRIVTELPRDGYALFRVSPGGSQRIAVLVEIREATDESFVLLYWPRAPESTGWFHLDAGAYLPCQSYGDGAADRVDAGCVLPGGHGAVVDTAFSKPWPSTAVLRHELEGDASAEDKTAPTGWYAVLRVARTAPAVPMAVEVVSMDETEPYDGPAIEQVR